jgi:hypothetical protein
MSILGKDDCWDWKASTMNSGYGQFVIRKNKKVIALSAHRTAYRLFNGLIPEGLQVNHTCDNKVCVNPNHLYAGTQKENLSDMIQRGRQNKDRSKMRGENNPKSKLTNEDVLEIRRLYKDEHIYQSELGKQFGVSQCAICCIVNRKSWKHL